MDGEPDRPVDPARSVTPRIRPMTTTTPIETVEAGLSDYLIEARRRVDEVLAGEIRPAEAAARCVLALAEGAGPSGMVGGQMADLQAEGRLDANLAELEAIHRRKTGALLRASLKMGAIVAGADEAILEAL